ncbi:MAG: LPS-assembly protein LptD, partial [Thermodesulfovibrionales bacterium]
MIPVPLPVIPGPLKTHYALPISHFTLLILSLLIIEVFLSPSRSESQGLYEFPVEISSEELTEQKGIYTLKGNIKIIKATDSEITRLQAEEGLYDSINEVAELKGNVYYEDNELSIKAVRAIINLRDRTGILYDAEIVFKKDYMRITSPEVKKISEDHFVFKKATFTTCEGPVPDWCIKGRDVDFIKGDRVTSKNATFNIKGIPVFYTPYIWAPALTERKTGLLIPSFSYSDRLGFELKTPFYIVFGENADSTVVLDIYSERGIGKGLEFRYRGFPEDYLDLWAYHIRDSKNKKDFYEFLLKQQYSKLESPQAVTDSINAPIQFPSFREILSIHTVTEDFFNTYNPLREVGLTRFLSSVAEISYTRPSSRFFIYGQYWQDLERDSSIVSQRLPEAGIFLYPSKLYDNLSYWLEARAGNFLREEGIKGQRIFLAPGIMHSAGEKIVLSQSLNLRGIYYW